MAKKYKVPFAFTGDKTTVPVALQPDGSVSYTQGFGPDYELDKLVDPINAKDVPRDQTNQLFFDVTESIGEVQLYGAALWSADMAPYPLNARVAYADKYWRSNTAANSDEPGVGAGWDDISLPQNIASFGIGTNTPPSIGNLDDPAKLGGLYRYSSASDSGTNPTGGALNGVVLVQPYSATLSRQTFMEIAEGAGITSARIWVRQINGATLGAWELLSGSLLDSVRIDVASAATVNLTTAAPNTRHINITGTTSITGFTIIAGRTYFVRFAGSLVLSNSASLVTQTGSNIVTQSGDTCIIRATAANVVEVLCYASATRDQYLLVRDQKANGVDGGTFTSGAWRTRDLNTVVANSIVGASLASNRITLPSGTYHIIANAPFQQTGGSAARTRSRIYSITDSVELADSANTEIAYGQGLAIINTQIVLGKTHEIELQHYSNITLNGSGFGSAIGVSIPGSEVYASVTIRRLR